MSVVFTLTHDARVLKHKVCRTVIRSDYRLSYEQAHALITNPQSGEPLSEALTTLNFMAGILRRKRMDSGALDIEQEEMRFRLDEGGHPTDIYFEMPTEAHHLIEEYMLLANRTVATLLAKTGKESVYRIHDKPDKDKLASLHKFERRWSDRVPQQTLDMLLIRAMATAVYSTVIMVWRLTTTPISPRLSAVIPI